MDLTISFTKVKLPYGWLGNMAPYPVQHGGKEWKTTEALFQAMRFDDLEIQEAIRAENSPMGCKMKVKRIVKELTKNNQLHKRVVEPQSEQDLQNMEICLRLKLSQHPKLKYWLKATGTALIYEDVTARGRKGSNLFWGAFQNKRGEWEGENHLGKIWMKLRSELP
jgi:predicted NAD-dependent protein-ADP-ribosyltransferase YbiA (DUF1768 family)